MVNDRFRRRLDEESGGSQPDRQIAVIIDPFVKFVEAADGKQRTATISHVGAHHAHCPVAAQPIERQFVEKTVAHIVLLCQRRDDAQTMLQSSVAGVNQLHNAAGGGYTWIGEQTV